MKTAVLYTLLICLLTFLFHGYATENWPGNHWPLFGTRIDRVFYNYGFLLPYLLSLPVALFIRRDLWALKPLAVIGFPVMLLVVWLCISGIVFRITD